MNSHLYEAGITGSEVFKAETFRKFMKAIVTYIQRIEASHKTVAIVLESIRDRIKKVGSIPAPTKSPARIPVSRPLPITIPRTDAGSSNHVTSKNKGKKVTDESEAPAPANSPAKNTRSVVRKLAAEDWVKSPAAAKLHDHVGIIISDDEELQSEHDTDSVKSGKDYKVVEGK